MRVLGIDTDSKGCFSVLDDEAHTLDLFYVPTTETEKRRADFDRRLLIEGLATIFERPVDYVYFEEQWSRANQSSVATFTFGHVYGGLLQATHDIAYFTEQTPVFIPVSGGEWKAKLSLDSDKSKAVRLADRVFPNCTKGWELASRRAKRSGKYTSGAESSLIAFYGSVLQRNRVRLTSNLTFYQSFELGDLFGGTDT